MSGRFAFMTVTSILVPASDVQGIVGDLERALIAAGGRPAGEDDRDDLPVFYVVATGGTERLILDAHHARGAAQRREPLVLVTHPHNNSLPAALETLAHARKSGLPGRIVPFSGPDDREALAVLDEVCDAVRTWRALERARLGRVGAPSDWLVASMPDATTVRETWGPTVVDVDMAELYERLDAADVTAVETYARELADAATGCREPSPDDLRAAARVFVALRGIVREHALDAVTVRCFDLVLERATTGCFALSALADAGITAGCEGDVVSTLGLLWAHTLTGVTPWMANPSSVDAAADSLLLAHCTVPRGIVERYELRSHFESGLGVGIQGVMPVGPVTLMRLGGDDLRRVWLAEGEIVKRTASERLCRTQVTVALRDGDVRALLTEPLGNHLVVVPGTHEATLRAWWEMFIAPGARA